MFVAVSQKSVEGNAACGTTRWLSAALRGRTELASRRFFVNFLADARVGGARWRWLGVVQQAKPLRARRGSRLGVLKELACRCREMIAVLIHSARCAVDRGRVSGHHEEPLAKVADQVTPRLSIEI